jgi:hypothetical protein
MEGMSDETAAARELSDQDRHEIDAAIDGAGAWPRSRTERGLDSRPC